MSITREQAHLIAELVRTVRTGWDTRAITAALASVADRDLADTVHAAIRCAENTAMHTPAAIGFTEAEHWRPTVRVTESPAEVQARLQAQRDRALQRAQEQCAMTQSEREARAKANADRARAALAESRKTKHQPTQQEEA